MRSHHPKAVSVFTELHQLFMATPGHPTITDLLDRAMRDWLIEHGVTPPPPPPPPVTSKASAARWRSKENDAPAK